MSWLSNLRALAGSLGSSATRPVSDVATGERLMRQIERHAKATLTSYEEKRRLEAQTFVEDFEAARRIGGGALADRFLAAIQSCNDAQVKRDQALIDAIRPALRKFSASERADFFDYLGLLQRSFGWVVEMNNYGVFVHLRGSELTSNFGRACSFLWRELLQVGFEVDGARAALVLALLGEEIPGLRLKGSISYPKGMPKLGVVREIERAARNGLALTAADRQNAARIIALICDVPEYRRHTGPEKTDLPLIVSLKAIAGVDQQDGFFARMRDCKVPRVPDLGYTEPSPECIAFWDAVLVEAARLLDEAERFGAEKGAMKSWLADPALFAGLFGGGDDPLFTFGWWNRNTKGEKGFSEYSGNALHAILHEEIRDDSFLKLPPLTPEVTKELRERAKTIDNDWPFDFATQGIPGIEMFALGGKDPSGSLLNHLADPGDGAPGKTWLKECGRLIGAFGVDTVLDCFGRWMALGIGQRISEIDMTAKNNIAIYAAAFNKYHVSLYPETIPEADTAEYAREVRRSALKAIVRAPGITRWRRSVSPEVSRYDVPKLTAAYSENNQIVGRGIALGLSCVPAEQAVPMLEKFASGLLVTHYEKHICRSPKAMSDIVWSLGQIGTREAAFGLGRIRRQIADKMMLKTIDRALAEAGKQLGLAPDDMQEIAMADHGIGAGGIRAVALGGMTVELVVASSTKAGLFTVEANGKRKRGIAKAFLALEGGKEIAEELQSAAADIEIILPEARRRIEAAWREGRNWDFAGWQDRLVDNGLLRTLTERLIWRFSGLDGPDVVAMIRNGVFIGPDGAELASPGEASHAHLWHPRESPAETVAAWRNHLTENRIRQPFIQAWRPIYLLTDAERATATYSNRFAGHILEQAPAMGILKKRGWQAYNRTMDGNSAEHERVRLALPHFGVAAEYWIAGIGSRIQEGKAAEHGGRLFAFISCDRVSFYALDKNGKPGGEPISLESVPARAFCEAMYDIDSIVGRTSIGADRNWQDRGAGAAHPLSQVPEFVDYHRRYSSGQASELARSRHDFLAKLLPGLAIADHCSLNSDFLMVDGKLATYKINLGSGNILIAPNDRYLCIVPAGRSEAESYVPYEGDEILSLIISKAMMLADDGHIEDKSILHQIEAGR
ncbi:DUF4132 domain-containing protein [Mesorhizobium australafricanum]|uniref:DUF4132 domain-containing protein n=1 Tax=Mesorhizobium australafricanum TaxID=3072311 RepID=A0ABU4WU33_9HYPH|nr:DUF4132 domain-containing protein [Mesorhizobium sp. VK3E]MDX8438427.1 DUF4132 domain-containing protein [Mesorhizobium sp. VK3E]